MSEHDDEGSDIGQAFAGRLYTRDKVHDIVIAERKAERERVLRKFDEYADAIVNGHDRSGSMVYTYDIHGELSLRTFIRKLREEEA